MTRIFHALSESHFISWHGMTCSIPLEWQHSIGMLIYICEYVQVNISCAFRGVIASVGVSLLCVAHPLWEKISGVGYIPVDGFHLG